MKISLRSSIVPLASQDRLVVGVSGGSDSIGLLCLLLRDLSKASQRLIVAHVNYGLRGRDSDRDERRVRELCEQMGVPFRVLKPQRLAVRARREKRSLQDLARQIRYSFFQKLVREKKAWGVAVAHHQEDQAETILDRLLRGAGPRGLSGLRSVQSIPFDNGSRALRIWRPLLPYSKDRIRDLLTEQGMAWREDRSNATDHYRRNQIRHQVIPFLSRWNPNLIQTLSRLGEVTSSEDEFMEGLLAPLEHSLKSRWKPGLYSGRTDPFGTLPEALQRRWVRAVCERLAPSGRALSFEAIELVRQVWTGRERGPRDVGFGLSAGRKEKGLFLRYRRLPGSVPEK